MPSWFEGKNRERDNYYNMGFPTDTETWDYAKDNNLVVIKVERAHDEWILWYKYPWH